MLIAPCVISVIYGGVSGRWLFSEISTISRGFVIIAKEEIEIGCYVIIYTRVFSFGLSFRLMISNEFRG